MSNSPYSAGRARSSAALWVLRFVWVAPSSAVLVAPARVALRTVHPRRARGGEPATDAAPMRRLAYADPPYPGQAKRYAPGVEVDHAALIERLEGFDGWALSTSAAALLDVWNLCPRARCGAWLKTFAPNGWARVRYSWEPLLFVTDRRGLAPGERSTVWDGLVCAPDLGRRHWQEVGRKGGGAKPRVFVEWVLELLEVGPDDTLEDLFPGSGAVARAVANRQGDLLEAGP